MGAGIMDIVNIKRNQNLIYHVGLLARDVEHFKKVKEMRQLTYRMWKEGRVHLLQERIIKGDPWRIGEYAYHVIGR